MAASTSTVVPVTPVTEDNSEISRTDFPADFIFGTGTSAYQVEGAYNVGGKSLSTWDNMTMNTPNIIADGNNGNVACDMYHRFKEDISHMKKMGFDSYRFSIAWTRILPGGRASMGVNREGIDYYNELIDTVIANGLLPFATLFHWDIPDILQKEYQGFLSKKIVDDFREYAEVCFWEFGDRVKFWTTFNEPWTYCVNNYVTGVFPAVRPATTADRAASNLPSHRIVKESIAAVPKRSRADIRLDRSDPESNAYIASKNLLLAHSAAVQLYRTHYQVFQEGKIGIVCNSHWHVPQNPNSDADKAAVKRAIDFMLGWFLEPVLYGQYPKSMIQYVPPENLPHFSTHESHMLKGSIDFFGLNYYTTNYVADAPDVEGEGYDAHQKLTFSTSRNNNLIGGVSGSSWLYSVPWGLYDHLIYLKNTYKDLPPVYITENGTSDRNDPSLTLRQARSDPARVKYHQDHIAYLLKAVKDKVDVRGYFVWAYCDNFEWTEGFSARFGIMYIDYRNNLTRYPKLSAIWFATFLKGKKKAIESARDREVDEQEDLAKNQKEEANLGPED